MAFLQLESAAQLRIRLTSSSRAMSGYFHIGESAGASIMPLRPLGSVATSIGELEFFSLLDRAADFVEREVPRQHDARVGWFGLERAPGVRDPEALAGYRILTGANIQFLGMTEGHHGSVMVSRKPIDDFAAAMHSLRASDAPPSAWLSAEPKHAKALVGAATLALHENLHALPPLHGGENVIREAITETIARSLTPRFVGEAFGDEFAIGADFVHSASFARMYSGLVRNIHVLLDAGSGGAAQADDGQRLLAVVRHADERNDLTHEFVRDLTRGSFAGKAQNHALEPWMEHLIGWQSTDGVGDLVTIARSGAAVKPFGG